MLHNVKHLLVVPLLLTLSCTAGIPNTFKVLSSNGTSEGLSLPSGNMTGFRNVGCGFMLEGNKDYVRAGGLDFYTNVMWNLSGGDTTQFRNGYYGTCMDSDSDYSSTLQLRSCDPKAKTQQFRLVRDAITGAVRIQSASTGGYLTFEHYTGINLYLGAKNDSGLQQWVTLELQPGSTSASLGRWQPGRSFPASPSDLGLVWPNEFSKANSDMWLISNHANITQMQPRVLVLSFYNKYTLDDVLVKAQSLAIAEATGSQYHGYNDAKAPVFLDYRIDKVIVLSDNSSRTLSTYVPQLSSRDYNLPHQAWNTAAFFNSTYSEYFGYKDPDKPGAYLDLCQLIERGIIHEVWIAGLPAEFLSYAPSYDVNLKPGPFDKCAGNGCFLHRRTFKMAF